MKISIRHLGKPTPKKWRKLGNALVAISTSAAIPTVLLGSAMIGWGLFGAGVVGKLIAEMTKEDDAPPAAPDNTDAGS